MNKIGSVLLAAVFFAETAFGGAATLFSDKKTFSDSENRDLASLPGISEIRDGSSAFFDGLESYLGDHFAGRDGFLSAYTDYLLASGKKNVRELLVLDSSRKPEDTASDGQPEAKEEANDAPDLSGYLFGSVYTVVRKRCGWLMETIDNSQKLYDPDFYYVILPEKTIALAEGTGGAADDFLCRENLGFIFAGAEDHNVSIIDLCSKVLEKYSISERADMYFKSDFHWNPLGGYRTAELLALELVKLGAVSPSSVPVASDFYWRDLSGRPYLGDLGRRISDEPPADEFIPFYKAAGADGFRYYDSLGGEPVLRSSIVSAGENSEDAADYNLLTTPNLGYYRVENPAALENKRVLILKDSMENAMTDYLSTMFSEINVVDPRCSCPSAEEIIKSRSIDLVLFIYHENNISDDLMNYLSAAN